MESKDTATNMRAELKSDLRAMDPHHPDRSGQLDERFERMEWRIEGVEARLGKRIDGIEARGEARIAGAATRLDKRIDDVCDSLSRRTTESEVRLATAINNFAGTLHDVHRLLQDRFGRRKLPDN